MKLIVLEGPNGAGKTTLARHLAVEAKHAFLVDGRAHVPVIDDVGRQLKPFEHYLLHLIRAQSKLTHSGAPVVLDGGHLGELIYGPVINGKDRLGRMGADILDRYIDGRDGQTVICLPPWRHVLANWLTTPRTEFVQSVGQLRDIYQRYLRLYFDPARNRNFVWFDYTRHHPRAFAQALLALHGTPLPDTCVGAQRPRFLFVGDRPSKPLDMPFMSLVNSSKFLYEVLGAAGYHERELAFANATGPDGVPHDLAGIVHHFKKEFDYLPTVITLGNYAAGRAEVEGGFTFYAVEHPQHVARFKRAQKEKYIAKLTQIRLEAR